MLECKELEPRFHASLSDEVLGSYNLIVEGLIKAYIAGQYAERYGGDDEPGEVDFTKTALSVLDGVQMYLSRLRR